MVGRLGKGLVFGLVLGWFWADFGLGWSGATQPVNAVRLANNTEKPVNSLQKIVAKHQWQGRAWPLIDALKCRKNAQSVRAGCALDA
jgi:hypothetical protein